MNEQSEYVRGLVRGCAWRSQVPMGPLKPPVIAGGKASPTALQLLPVHVQ